MGSVENPLLPTTYDIVWTVVFALGVVLALLALVSIARIAKRLTSTQALIWTLVVIFVPVLGPLAWLAIRSASNQMRRGAVL